MPTIREDIDDFIEHSGRIGMKWGRHVFGKTSTAVGGAAKKAGTATSTAARIKAANAVLPAHVDHKEAHTLAQKPIRSLSNEELKTVNKRLSLEKNYAEVKQQRSTIGRGQKQVAFAVAAVGTGVAAVKIINSPAGRQAIAAGQKILAGH